MVVCGASRYFPGRHKVDTYGFINTNNGWTTIGELPGSALPTTDPEVVFVVWGLVGNFQGNKQGFSSVVEVALGRADLPGIFTDTIHRFEVRDGNMQGNLRGIPFFYVRSYTVTGGAARNVWATVHSLALKARIFYNGDEPGSLNVTAEVSDVTMLGFVLSQIGANKWLIHYQNTPTSISEVAGGTQVTQTASSGVFADGQRWLVFGSSAYHPRKSEVAPGIEMVHLPTGLWASATQLLGRPLGQRPRGRGDTNGTFVRYQQGGFRLLTATDDTQIGLRGYNPPLGPIVPWIHVSWEMFAVRVDQLGFFREVQEANPTSMLNDLDHSPLAFEGAEWTRPYFSDFNIACQSICAEGDAVTRSFMSTIGTNNSLSLLQNQLAHHTHSGDEGCPAHQGTIFSALRPDDVQLRFWGLRNPLEPSVGRAYLAAYFTAIGWQWENDPDFGGFPQPAVPPEILINIPRQSLHASLLDTLPIEPDDIQQVTIEIPKHSMRTDGGYMLTWPRYTKPDRVVKVSWNGITRADGLTLQGFHLATGVQAFAWTMPQESAARPWVMLELNGPSDLGNDRVSCSAMFVELIFTDEAP